MSSKRKPSKMWNHFTLSDCKKKATCQYCRGVLSYSQATMSNLRRHLKTKHPEIDISEKEEAPMEVYTVEEVGSEGLKTYEITMKGFEEMEQEEIALPLREPPDPDWTPQTSAEWKVEVTPDSFKEKKDRKRSAVWNHFKKTECKTSGVCMHCGKIIRLGTVSNLARHLRQKHPTTPFSLRNSSYVKHEDSDKYEEQDIPMLKNEGDDLCMEVVEINVDDIQNPIRVVETKTIETTSNFVNLEFQRSEVNDTNNVTQSSQTEFLLEDEDFDIDDYIRPSKTAVHAKQVDQQLVKMIVKGCHSLAIVEQTAFRNFVKLLNPKYQIPSANKITLELIPDCYRKVEKRATSSLRDAEGVCLYLDRWKSKSSTYMCVMAHFINSDCKFESIFLSCHVLAMSENAEDLSDRLVETVNDWGIAGKIVAVLTDNSDIISNAVRLCNWCHIPHFIRALNIVMHESLLTIKPILWKVTTLIEALTKFPETIAEIYARQKALNLPPVKLIKKVKNDRSSTFATVEMLTRLVKLKTAIHHVQQDREGLKLTDSEWKILIGLVDFFSIFKVVKKEIMEENRVVMSKIIYYIRAIKQEIKKIQSSTTSPSEVTFSATTAETAISNQFKDLDNIDLVTNMLVLDPRLKKHVFEDESESASACSTLKKEVCEMMLPDLCYRESEPDPNSLWYSFDSEVRKLNAVKDPIGKGILELENYLQEQLLSRNEDPLVWWKERSAIYPRLFKLAKKYLCVTAKSAPRESISYKSAYMLSQLKSCALSPSESEIMFLHHNM